MEGRVRGTFYLVAAVLLAAQPARAQETDFTVRRVLDIFTREDHPPLTPGAPPGATTVLPARSRDRGIYLLDRAALTADDVESAVAIEIAGRWSVTIELADDAAREWAKLTSELACLRDDGDVERSQVAVVVDDEVVTSAGMQEPVAGGGGVECGTGITGGEIAVDVGDENEAKTLAEALGGSVAQDAAIPPPTPSPKPERSGGGSAATVVIGVVGVGLVVLMMRRSFGGRADGG